MQFTILLFQGTREHAQAGKQVYNPGDAGAAAALGIKKQVDAVPGVKNEPAHGGGASAGHRERARTLMRACTGRQRAALSPGVKNEPTDAPMSPRERVVHGGGGTGRRRRAHAHSSERARAGGTWRRRRALITSLRTLDRSCAGCRAAAR